MTDIVTLREHMPNDSALRDRIVDATIGLAETAGWEGVRLRIVAEQLGVTTADIVDLYRDVDEVADAWFHRAWRAMLAPPPEGFAAMPAVDRIHMVMMRWFDTLAPHRKAAAEAIQTKLYPSHPHHWVPLVFNLSRTIQWVRDAAMLDARGLRRQVEEVGLTGVFLATLAVWSQDDSPDQQRTRDTLRRQLEAGDRLMVGVWGRQPPPGHVVVDKTSEI
jgi:AcrR family transcriptional regulator